MPVFPVPILAGAMPTISDRYGYSATRGRLHAGSDIMYRRPSAGAESLPVYAKNYYMPNGVPAMAYDDGRVTRADFIDTGGRVEIQHANGISSKYFHLSRMNVQPGQLVSAGDVVGTISHNPVGYALNHLHFEIHKGGNAVDPAPYLAAARLKDRPVNLLLMAALALAAGYAAYKFL
jgi:murein DD-endopeptidase MepM/ murein hydrolase activator NlpD